MASTLRAGERFADPPRVEQELIDPGLLDYCRPAPRRRAREGGLRQRRTWESIPGRPLGGVARKDRAAPEAEAPAGVRS
ncbi:MAG: hypothetical protein JOZ63_01340 [Planctomycetaceae bacterium]|nr:hypothetical protein [Planctomycetaceae bacterium]MBV8609203.1 hypothetical protein [Singulisphaera sp.]